MDPRDRADETLARARARGRFVVTPESATSPMDAASTVRIPREVVSAAERGGGDPNSTRVLAHPGQQVNPQAGQQNGWPGQQQGGMQHGQQGAQQGAAQNGQQGAAQHGQQNGQQGAAQQGGQPGAAQQTQQGAHQTGPQAVQQSGQQAQQGGQPAEQYGWPVDDQGGGDETTRQLPPNPYQAQRPAGQFGPLGSRAAQPNPPR